MLDIIGQRLLNDVRSGRAVRPHFKMPSISRHIRSADTLLECLDAVRHGPALASLSSGLIAAGLLVGLARQIAFREGGLLATSCVVLALAIVFYAANLAGVLLMDEARQRMPRPLAQSLGLALRSANRILGVMILLGVTYAAGGLFLALVLVICKMPWLGPVLYAVAMPVAVLITGVALLALPMLVLPLAAPAVWDGADAAQCLGRLFAIARTRLLSVVIQMLLVTLLAAVVGAVAMFVVAAGGTVVAGMSMAILGVDLSMGSLAGDGEMGLNSHLGAGLIGGVAVAALALVMPGLVCLRGACAVYLAHEDVVQAHEEELPARFPRKAEAPSTRAVEPATTPGVLVMPSSKAASMATTASMAHSPEEEESSGVDVDLPLDVDLPAVGTFALRCHACGRFVLREDRYCGHCGAPLPARA